MNNLTQISVTCSVETALKKLKKAQIPVYDLKKQGAFIIFKVENVNIKKVFAIFAHTCYNVKVKKNSGKNRALTFALNRVGLFIGCALFLAAVTLSQSFIFKVSVTGSGSYLYNEVITIVKSLGVKERGFYKGLDKPLALSQIMALPNVTFCSIDKRGSVLIIDVHTDEQQSVIGSYSPLKSGAAGKVLNIVAICGTAEVQVGDEVAVGDTLIGAYYLDAEGEKKSTLAVGYAEIECSACINYAADCESSENQAAALNSTLLYSDSVTSSYFKVKPSGEGVVYEVTFTFVSVQKINIE